MGVIFKVFKIKDEKCEYKLPFEEKVGLNPSLKDMAFIAFLF